MIIGCGVDIVKVERFNMLALNEKFLQRFFHSEEVATVLQNPLRAAETLASRFAAKEAFGKALGTGIGCLTLKNICVSKNALGKPSLTVYDDARDYLHKSGANVIHLSLSHEKEFAVAQVILEKIEEKL